MKNRAEAWQLLNQYTKGASLLKHALGVEAAMRWYAQHFNCTVEQTEEWAITGLLHDFDYEQHQTTEPPDGHPFFGNRILAEQGYSQEMRDAIMGHATYSGVARDSQMAKVLFAVDELSGLVTASVLVRPDKNIFNLEPSSVMKKMKDKAFAKGCNRDDIRLGAQELGIELDQHIANVIQALRAVAGDLGLTPQ